MESKNWVLDAEMAMENLRKTAEIEFERLKKDFPAWPENDARRWAVARFPTIFFVPVLGLYLRRSYMDDAAWWERYAPGAGPDLLKNGRQHFDRHLKGKLILDLVGGVEHPFRVILNSLDPVNKNVAFSSLYRALFRQEAPYLEKVPEGWSETLDLLRHIRNSVHNSWVYFPESRRDTSISFKGKTYTFRFGHQIDFPTWEFLNELSADTLRIMVGVIRDPKVAAQPDIPDPGAGEVWRG